MNADEALESCGLTLARIPAGKYEVGLSADDVPLLAKPPQADWVPTLATPGRRVAVDEFCITKDVLRLSHWQQIAAHPNFGRIADLVPDEHLQRTEARRTTETTVVVEPSAGDLRSKGCGARHRRIPRQPDPDPVLTLGARAASKVASALGASLPRRHEWNLRHKGTPDAPGRYILRSISDLGAMAFMIPGIRPNTWGGGNDWYRTKKHLTFSGPVLPCYAPATVGIRERGKAIIERVLDAMGEALTASENGDDVRAHLDKRLYREAGFRLVFR